MLKSNLATYPDNPNTQVGHSYLENVARATLALLTAILAIAPVRSGAVATKSAAADNAKLNRTYELLRMARQYESTMPNQATELRYLAGRD